MEKSNRVVFDTNIWVGLLIEVDSLHTKAVATVNQYSDKVKVVPEYVLLETVSLVKMLSSTAEAKQCLDFFLSSEEVTILPSAAVYTETIYLFQTLPDKSLSFVDMSLLALSQDYEVKTFDKKLAAAIKKLKK